MIKNKHTAIFFDDLKEDAQKRLIKDELFDSEDDGQYIAVSTFYSHIFQHKATIRYFVLNKETKEWRDCQTVIIERHQPEKLEPVESNIIQEIKR